MLALPKMTGAWKRLVRITGVLLLGALVGGGPAMADGRGHGHGYGRDDDGGRGRGRWERGDGDWDRGGPRRYRYAPPPYAYGSPGGYAPPYMGPSPYGRRALPPGLALRRGGMVPPEFRGALVPDYAQRRLRPPPPGFGWVRMGDRYMLVNRASGQIFDVIGD